MLRNPCLISCAYAKSLQPSSLPCGPGVSHMWPKSRGLRFSYISFSCMTQLIRNIGSWRSLNCVLGLPLPTGGAFTVVTSIITIHHSCNIELQPLGSRRGSSALSPMNNQGKALTSCLDSSRIPRLLAPAKVPDNKKECYKANYLYLLGSKGLVKAPMGHYFKTPTVGERSTQHSTLKNSLTRGAC